MTTDSTQQADREVDVFRRFISITGIPVNPDSVEKCDPPAPDILCHDDTDGPIAFELVELINHEFSARLGRQATTQRVLEDTHDDLPAHDKTTFDQQFRNATIYFKFRQGVTRKRVRWNISDVFRDLSALPNGFEGDVTVLKSSAVSKIVESISISRSGFSGPVFSVENIGGLGDSVVAAIEKKLKKHYESDYPIELLGYLDIAAIFPRQLWNGPASRFFDNLPDLRQFRRIWIVDIRNNSVEIVHPVP